MARCPTCEEHVPDNDDRFWPFCCEDCQRIGLRHDGASHEERREGLVAIAASYAGPRLSTLGPRVRPGPRTALGRPLRDELDDARELLLRERRVHAGNMHDVHLQFHRENPKPDHWSEPRQEGSSC